MLLNQAPHALDRYAWLCGMPTSVLGRCDTALHAIEVEDSASAIFRHANGAHGSFHCNTVEAPGVSQLVVTCERGRVQIDNGVLKVTRLRGSIREAIANTESYYAGLESETRDLGGGLLAGIPELLALFYDNVAVAAAGQATLLCPGAEALWAVELANAILLSSAQGCEQTLPLDRAAYDEFLNAKLAVAESLPS